MRKMLKSLVMSCLAVTMILGVALSAHAAQITINAAYALTPNHPVTAVYQEMIKNIQARADKDFPGALKINLRGGVEIIAANEQAEAVRTGMIDMSATAASYYVSAMPEMDTLALSELDPSQERNSPLLPYLQQIHRQKLNAMYLGRLGPGITFYFFAVKPFANLEDLKGRRVRVSPTNIPFMKMLDVEPIAMPGAELYTAVERGVVEGFVVPPSDLPDFGLIPMAKYVLIPPFYHPTNPVLINAQKWDSLPDGIKKIFSEEMAKSEVVIMDRARAQEKDVLDKVRAAGGKFVELPPAEAAKFLSIADKALMDTTLSKAPVESQKIFDLSRKPK